ncbi:MAG: hypothetical protein NXI10_03815 [bacterium]|nr:hypothetical protein [bacterium]
MKTYFFLFFLLIGGISFGQTDSTVVTEDTSNIYVINNTNRLIQVGDDYSIEFRDLKRLTEVHYIRFEDEQAVRKFFSDCYKVLEQNTTIATELYIVNRNVLSRNVARIEHDDLAYFLLAYGTLEKMEKAFDRYVKE